MLFAKCSKYVALILCAFMLLSGVLPVDGAVINVEGYTKVVEKSKTPIQDRLFNKSLDEVSDEEISEAFIEAVFGADIKFFKKGKVREVIVAPSYFHPDGLKYTSVKREYLTLDVDNSEHIKLFEERGFSEDKKIQKFDKKRSVLFLVNVLGRPSKIQAEVQKVKLEMPEHFDSLKQSLQKRTGLRFHSKIHTQGKGDGDLTDPKVVLIYYKLRNITPMVRVGYSKKDLPFSLEPNIVFNVNFSGKKYQGFTGKLEVARNHITLKSTCGKLSYYMYGPINEIIPGCILKSIGLSNLKYFGKIEYGLLFAEILYNDRLKPGMTEEEVRNILPEIIQSIKHSRRIK